ncbi:hypothetical protein FS749_000910 [Ceratobasidium sp. UAMH 11750]|nr:hypothetical protein FS749_000910 [Ceratobasidium sp. UAMH 11750]
MARVARDVRLSNFFHPAATLASHQRHASTTIATTNKTATAAALYRAVGGSHSPGIAYPTQPQLTFLVAHLGNRVPVVHDHPPANHVDAPNCDDQLGLVVNRVRVVINPASW